MVYVKERRGRELVLPFHRRFYRHCLAQKEWKNAQILDNLHVIPTKNLLPSGKLEPTNAIMESHWDTARCYDPWSTREELTCKC